MSGKDTISATVDPEIAEYVRAKDESISACISRLLEEDMFTETMSTREKLERQLEELDEEIEDLQDDLDDLLDEREVLVERIDTLDERKEEQRERIHAGLCHLKGVIPDKRDDVMSIAADKAGLPESEMSRLYDAIDLGHYAAGGYPADISDSEKADANAWADENL